MTSKQGILSLVFFLCLALLLFVFNAFIVKGVQYSEHAQTGKVSLLMSHKIDPEVIVFGASDGESGIKSQVLEEQSGQSVFNMSLDGTSVLQFKDLVYEFNDYSLHAKTVVFAIGPFALSKVELPSSMNRYYAWVGNKYIQENHFLNTIPDFKKLKYIPFYGFVLYDSFFYKHAFDGWTRTIGLPVLASTMETKGWNEMDIQWGENNSVGVLDSHDVSVDPIMKAEYKLLIKALNKKGRNVVFVLMPSQQDAFRRYRGYDQLRTALKEIIHAPNRLIDCSEDAIMRNKKWFYNYTHLNASGAALFSEKLALKMAIKDIKNDQ